MAYVEPTPLDHIQQWEQDQHEARIAKMQKYLAQREADYVVG